MAAHSIQDKGYAKPFLPTDCFFLLGVEEPFSINASISQFVLHPNWYPWTPRTDGDLAIALLESPILYSEYVSPVCLYDKKIENLYHKFGTIGGWGATKENLYTGRDDLLQIKVNITYLDDCKMAYQKLWAIESQNAF